MRQLRYIAFALLLIGSASGIVAQPSTVSLDSCRHMALRNNKQLAMARQNINTARYQNKQAFAAYLPAIDFAGGYMYNQKDISVIAHDELLPVKSFNLEKQQYEYALVTNPLTGQPIKGPDGQYIPQNVALLPKDALTYDIHNVFFGAVTLTQPVFMGGKIVAMNKITHFAEQLAETMRDNEAQNVVYAVDGAYWQVVSLRAKQKLARAYVDMLDSLCTNVDLLLQQGMATRAELLSVQVKLNEANVDLTKVDNGLVLSRMALAQVCGLPVNTTFTLADEGIDAMNVSALPARQYDMQQVYDNRQDIRALNLGIDIAGQQKKVALSTMLPNLAIVGSYSFSNPNMFNGFSKRFAGAFSVGAMLTIPLWHWGGNYYKYKEAESQETLMRLRLEDAKDLVQLQVSQAAFRASEAVKTLSSARSNLVSANENLRTANLAFKEGVATPVEVMAAQTAWLKAYSQNIDAAIDVHMCDTYLSKTLGQLAY